MTRLKPTAGASIATLRHERTRKAAISTPDDKAERGTDPRATDEACTYAVRALARALELHDYQRGAFAESTTHIERVTTLASLFVTEIAPDLASDPCLAHGFRLHDVGMLGIPASILAKPGPLTSAELDEIREHPWLGERIVAPIPPLAGAARDVIAAHHEKWDGTGYPRGLRGDEIPVAARLFALVDAFDVMTNDQPYRDALPVELALAELDAKAGAHFDPELTRAFIRLLEELGVTRSASAPAALAPLYAPSA